ncbi:Uncharacterised protein g11027 [Pycnogonum litorale]
MLTSESYAGLRRRFQQSGSVVSKNYGFLPNGAMSTCKRNTSDGSGCECSRHTCGCCAHLEVEKIYLNDTGCVNVTYLPEQYGLSFTVSIDSKIIFNETVSAKNPPPYCFGVPYLKRYAELCIIFYDMTYSSHLHGCIKLQARLLRQCLAEYKLGCFNIDIVR